MRSLFSGLGIARSAAFAAALCALGAALPAHAQNATQITVPDYVNSQYYPTIILGMKFSGDSWDFDSDRAMTFGGWSVKADPSTMIFARYHPADSDVPQSIEVDGLLCQTGGTGDWFVCYMALADARGLSNVHSDKLCAVFAEGQNDDRHTEVECPVSLEIITPPLPQ